MWSLTRDIAERFNRLVRRDVCGARRDDPGGGCSRDGIRRSHCEDVEDVRTCPRATRCVCWTSQTRSCARSAGRLPTPATRSGSRMTQREGRSEQHPGHIQGDHRQVRKRSLRLTSRTPAGYGDLKTRVAEVVIEELAPIRERYDALMERRR